jgi:hypothetical protein
MSHLKIIKATVSVVLQQILDKVSKESLLQNEHKIIKTISNRIDLKNFKLKLHLKNKKMKNNNLMMNFSIKSQIKISRGLALKDLVEIQ